MSKLDIDTKLLKEDILKLKKYYSRSPKRDDIRIDFPKLELLSEALENLTGEHINLDGLFTNTEKVHDDITNKYINYSFDFITFIERDLLLIYAFLREFYVNVIDADFINKPVINYVKRYNLNDFKDILMDYFKLYGKDTESIVKKYFDDGRIQMNYKLDGMDGLFLGTICNKSGYIFTTKDKLDTNSLVIIAHELGHAIDNEKFFFSQHKKAYFDDVLGETPSTFFELGLIDYLKKNKIDEVGASLLFRNRLLRIARSTTGISRFIVHRQNNDVMDIDLEGNVIVDDGTVIPLRDRIIYGLGYYLAIFTQTLLDGDYTDFMKDFYTFLSTRKECDFESSLETLGLSQCDLMNTNIIKSKIEENSMILKKRFNL